MAATGYGSVGKPYGEFPPDQVIQVHWRKKDQPPIPINGTATFIAAGVTFAIPGGVGPYDSNSFSNMEITGNAFAWTAGDSTISIQGGDHCSVEADIYAEVTSGPADAALLDVYMELVDAISGAVYASGGPAIATNGSPGTAHFSGSIPTPAVGQPNKVIKVRFRASGNDGTIGFGRTYPGVIVLTVTSALVVK